LYAAAGIVKNEISGHKLTRWEESKRINLFFSPLAFLFYDPKSFAAVEHCKDVTLRKKEEIK
jgi:hypothetical protein